MISKNSSMDLEFIEVQLTLSSVEIVVLKSPLTILGRIDVTPKEKRLCWSSLLGGIEHL